MALINCPECGSRVSDAAGACPNCGHPLRKQKPKKNRTSTLKTGAIINIAGGLGFILMIALGMQSAQNNSSKSTKSISINLSNANLDAIYITTIILILITILSIAILVIKQPKRNPMMVICGIQVLGSIAAIAIDLFTWNFTICCGTWLIFWGTVVQAIGSIICISGALKLDN